MTRFFAFFLLLFTAFSISGLHGVWAQSAQPPSRLTPLLRPAATVSGDSILLGDLFENLDPRLAQITVASAPPPGRRVALDAGWLSSVARSAGIRWSPSTGYERIIVERAGIQLRPEDIEKRILEELVQRGLDPSSSLEMGASDIILYAPADRPVDIGVRDVLFDPKSSGFSATLEVPRGAPNAQRLRVTGRAFAVSEIPVLTRDIKRGDIIAERDIEWQQKRGEMTRQGYAEDAHQVIGMAARRTMRAGMPVRLVDLEAPLLVRKGGGVTIIFKQGNMSLSAQGKALQSGALGDSIQIMNAQSRRTIEATVTGPDEVSVLPGSRPIAN